LSRLKGRDVYYGKTISLSADKQAAQFSEAIIVFYIMNDRYSKLENMKLENKL